MSIKIHSDMPCKDAFILGAAKAFFVCAYADFVEDEDREDDGHEYPRAMMGADWMDMAPEPPPAAFALAGELWALLGVLNKETAPCGVVSLLNQAADADKELALEDQPDSFAEDFGHYMAMEAMGHGVSWFDDHETFPVEIPHIECHQFSFDPEAYRAE